MIPIDLTGKNCIITGGTRGIGGAISLILAEAGASTAAVYNSNHHAAELSLEQRRKFSGGSHFNWRADLSRAGEINGLYQLVERDLGGRVDALVLNAATIHKGSIDEIDDHQWQHVMDTNLTSAYRTVKMARPYMQSGSSIVSIASGAGHDGLPGLLAYSTSKAGLIMFTQALAQDLGPHGIRANVVSPGGIDTSGDAPKPANHNALRRTGVPQDIAGVVLLFCSDLARYITGQAIRVNGGTF